MRILFLSTWFPYPLSQGSKIRAYHLLRALAQRHEVALISFEDSSVEPDGLAHIAQFCAKLETVRANPFAGDRRKRGAGWFSLRPSAVVSSYSQAMARRVRLVAAEWQPDAIIALTFVTAPYALQVAGTPRLLDVDNHMSRMLYESYQAATGVASRARHWLAWWKFRRYENWLIRQFDMAFVVSQRDYLSLSAVMPDPSEWLAIAPNGADLECAAPGLSAPEPNTLVYGGSLSYQANYDAVDYFLREIFPLVQDAVPEATLQITGSVGRPQVEQFAWARQVRFTGYLDDVRPTVAASWASIVPLRIGGGSRLKVLESMALGTPVVSTSKGAEGLEVVPEKHLLIADSSSEFAAQTVRLLRDPGLRNALSAAARRLVADQYDWTGIGSKFCEDVERAVSSTGRDSGLSLARSASPEHLPARTRTDPRRAS